MASTLNKRGKVLIPVFALGRTQELLLLLDEYWETHSAMKRLGSIVYLNTLAKKSMILFKESINMMNNSIRNAISDRNPFDFRNVTIPDKVDEWVGGRLGETPAMCDFVFPRDDGKWHFSGRFGEIGPWRK